jgi:mRNA interferase MazF
MVRQGDIIKISFNPQEGHEQAGYGPAVVVSNDFFNRRCSMTLLCPITDTNNKFPLHVPLDDRTETTGVVLCEQIRSMDLNARQYNHIERIPDDLMETIINIITAEIER